MGDLAMAEERVRLGDVCKDALLGVPPSLAAAGDGATETVRVINVRDLPERVGYVIDGTIETRQMPCGRKLDRSRTEVGDVVLVARGGYPKVGVVGPGGAGAVIAGSLMLIRTDSTRLPGEALAVWLGSSRGKHDLTRMSRSSVAVLSLSTRDVLDLEVPVPPSRQAAALLAELFSAGADAYRYGIEVAELRHAVVVRQCENLLLGLEEGSRS